MSLDDGLKDVHVVNVREWPQDMIDRGMRQYIGERVPDNSSICFDKFESLPDTFHEEMPVYKVIE